MRALVVYESMFGNTRAIAESVASSLETSFEIDIVRALEAPALTTQIGLVIVGSPTHGWGLPRASTRQGAVARRDKVGSAAALEPGAESAGVREWLDGLATSSGFAAAFDTRVRAPAFLTGRASPKIAAALRRGGRELVIAPESFLVERTDRLVAGERERAFSWGETVAREVSRRLEVV